MDNDVINKAVSGIKRKGFLFCYRLGVLLIPVLVIVADIAIQQDTKGASMLFRILWVILIPFVVLSLVSFGIKNKGALLGGALGAFSILVIMHYAVMNSSNSTAVIGYFWIVPNALFPFMPVGMIAGYVAGLIVSAVSDKLNISETKALASITIILAATVWTYSAWERPEPEDIKPGIHLNSISLNKTKFAEDSIGGQVTDIKYIFAGADNDKQIIAAGEKGAFSLGMGGLVKSKLPLQDETGAYYGPVKIIDLENDGVYEFIDEGNHGIRDIHIFNSKGEVLWKHKRQHWGGIAYGDLDSDGIVEFVINDINLSIYDIERKLLKSVHRSEQEFGHDILVADINGDSKNEIVSIFSSAGQQWISVLGLERGFIDRIQLGEYSSNRIVPFLFNDNGSLYFPVYSGRDEVSLVNTSSKKAEAKFKLNVYYALDEFSIRKVRLNAEEPPYYVVFSIVRYRGKNRRTFSRLLIYNDQQRLVYNEAYPHTATGISVVPAKVKKAEALLVGGVNKVWKYSLN